jgi:hypothetical protein
MDNGVKPGRAHNPDKSRHFETAFVARAMMLLPSGARSSYDCSREPPIFDFDQIGITRRSGRSRGCLCLRMTHKWPPARSVAFKGHRTSASGLMSVGSRRRVFPVSKIHEKSTRESGIRQLEINPKGGISQVNGRCRRPASALPLR